MQFPLRDLTNQFISLSYQDVVQRYDPSTSTIYLLDGYGDVILSFPSSSNGQILTTDQTASYSLYSDFSGTSSYSLYSVFSGTASYSLTSKFADSSNISTNANTASYVQGFNVDGMVVSASYAISASNVDSAVFNNLVLALEFKFVGNLSATDPGNGKFKYDNGDQTAISNIYISSTTNNGLDVTAIIKSLNSGSIQLYIQQKNDSTKASLFQVANSIIDNSGWFTIPVLPLSTAPGGLPNNNQVCAILIINKTSIIPGQVYPITASYASTASLAITSSRSISASFSLTSSFALNVPITASFANTASFSIATNPLLTASYIDFSIENDSTSVNTLWASSSWLKYNKTILNIPDLTKDPSGFPNRTDSILNFDNASQMFSISESVIGNGFKIYSTGKELIKSYDSIPIVSVPGTETIIYYDGGDYTLKSSVSEPAFQNGNVVVVSIYWDGTHGLVGEERHGIVMDGATHQYLHSVFGTQYGSGFGGQFTGSSGTFTIDPGIIYDEDLPHGPTASINFCRVLYHSASVYVASAVQTSSYLFASDTSSVLAYDPLPNTSSMLTSSFVAYWIMATNDTSCPIYSIMGQRTDTSLSASKTNALFENLSLGNLPFDEMKLLYRIIYDGSGSWHDTTDYRHSSLNGNSFVATSHGSLTGLLNDDHPQYLLLAGRGTSQTVQGNINLVDSNALTLNGIRMVSGDTAKSNSYFGGGGNPNNIGINNIAIGSQAGATDASNNNSIQLGVQAGQFTTLSTSTIQIGYQAGQYAYKPIECVQIGYQAGQYATMSTLPFSYGVVQIGPQAGQNSIITNINYGSTIQIGYQTGQSTITASGIVQIGYQAGLFGFNSLGAVMIGSLAGLSTSNSSQSVLIGFSAGELSDQSANAVEIGAYAGQSAINANGAILIGYQSGLNATSASGDTFIGYNAGYGNNGSLSSSLDTYCTFIGYNTSRDSSAGTNALTNSAAIGANATVGISNAIVLGGTGSNAVSVGIGTPTPSASLHVIGNIIATSFTGSFSGSIGNAATATSASYVLTSSNSITASYALQTPVGCLLSLCQGYTPSAVGADVVEMPVPYDPRDGTTSFIWNIRRVDFRIGIAGGAPAITIEKSTSAGSFSAATVTSIYITTGSNEGAATGSLGTINSGDKLRFNIITTGSISQNWTVNVELGK